MGEARRRKLVGETEEQKIERKQNGTVKNALEII